MTVELSTTPCRATYRASHRINPVTNGCVVAPLAELCYQRSSVLVERLLEPPRRAPHHGDNPAGAPACVAVRK